MAVVEAGTDEVAVLAAVDGVRDVAEMLARVEAELEVVADVIEDEVGRGTGRVTPPERQFWPANTSVARTPRKVSYDRL